MNAGGGGSESMIFQFFKRQRRGISMLNTHWLVAIISGTGFGCCICCSIGLASTPIPAFPGAQGPGAIATGGRGGDVYHVTNLSADKDGKIPGSLQYGINTAPSNGRIIVFDVGGTIYLAGQSAADTLRYNKGNITIAGQTAPGPGITIAGTGTKWTGSNLILRNISIRPNKAPVTYDAFSLQVKNSIIDHVSATWFSDEGISITDAGETSTVQYANISEGLNYGGHAFGSIITTEKDGTHYSFNHNLYAHNASRMPRIGAEIGQTGAVLEFTNNVLYNWASTKVGYGGRNQPASTNFINNYYIKGNSNNTENLFVGDDDPADSGVTKVYESGNKLDGNKNGKIDGNTIGGRTYFRGGLTLYSQPFAVQGSNPRETADQALQRVLDYGGANWQNRSPIDQRIINSVRNGTGQVIADLSSGVQATEWATLMSQRPDAQGNAPFKRPGNFDTDRDGMPDAWETAHGLNPNVPNHNGDFDSDGYTDLEEYINDLGAWPAPGPIVFTNGNGNGRYAQIGNWGNIWQPSRFDTARIDAGTVTVDAVGQQAGKLMISGSGGNGAQLLVTNGWLNVQQTISVENRGSVNQTQGTVRAGQSILIGSSSQPGYYYLGGGVLSTPLLSKGHSASVFSITGGTLRAEIVDFDLVNQGGKIAPGSHETLENMAALALPDMLEKSMSEASPLIGTLQVKGNLNLQNGVLQIDILSPSQNDRLLVDKVLALGGTLEVVIGNGYSPAYGTEWLIASASEIQGRFTSVSTGYSVQQRGSQLYLVSNVPEPSVLKGMIVLAGLLCRSFAGIR